MKEWNKWENIIRTFGEWNVPRHQRAVAVIRLTYLAGGEVKSIFLDDKNLKIQMFIGESLGNITVYENGDASIIQFGDNSIRIKDALHSQRFLLGASRARDGEFI